MPEIRRNVFNTRYAVRICKTQNKPINTINQYSDFLMHYGISGQKWGLRRYQNEDRTLTEEGKARYNKSSKDDVKEARAEKKALKKAEKEAKKAEKEAKKPESATWKAKDAKFLSDEELNRRNSRLQRERQYIDMTTPGWKKGAKRTAGDLLKALTILPLAGIVTDEARKVYRGEFNKFAAPWLKNQVRVDTELKVK